MPATSTAQYLANASVLVTTGDTKAVFDPLFRNDFGQYALVPAQMERALFDGTAPFDGLDAVFVSHYHEDHFSAVDPHHSWIHIGETIVVEIPVRQHWNPNAAGFALVLVKEFESRSVGVRFVRKRLALRNPTAAEPFLLDFSAACVRSATAYSRVPTRMTSGLRSAKSSPRVAM